MTDTSKEGVIEEKSDNDQILAKCEEYLAGWKRAQADYINLRNETEKEKAGFMDYAQKRFLEKILPAIDQFEIALQHIPDLSTLTEEDSVKIESWIKGIKAVKSSWENIFSELGLSRVNTDVPFDPMIHEAVGNETSDKPEGAIIRVMQSGWIMGDKVLRPAKVIVTTKIINQN